MANQFGEYVPDEVAYAQARASLSIFSVEQLSVLVEMAGTPLKLRALEDEIRERNCYLVGEEWQHGAECDCGMDEGD